MSSMCNKPYPLPDIKTFCEVSTRDSGVPCGEVGLKLADLDIPDLFLNDPSQHQDTLTNNELRMPSEDERASHMESFPCFNLTKPNQCESQRDNIVNLSLSDIIQKEQPDQILDGLGAFPGIGWPGNNGFQNDDPLPLLTKPVLDPAIVERSQVFMPDRTCTDDYITQSPSPSNASDTGSDASCRGRSLFWSFESITNEPCSPKSLINLSPRSQNSQSNDSTDSTSPKESEAEDISSNAKTKLSMRKNTVSNKDKDESYWKRRIRNNKSAKKSRDAKRAKEEFVAWRIRYLEEENVCLKMCVQRLMLERNIK
ncbi:uncharacterized protein LOC116603045 [Nematostella vectensis]|uniref:uncharacterized protein LOC116603045 n=1 Tax=Nematostella vectensis TaxID=45351 RepID=UPI0013900213|nr:uncharacterized protein LOC116603045 [Nematostella vectensis]